MQMLLRAMTVLAITMGLAACGGGGESTEEVPAFEPFAGTFSGFQLIKNEAGTAFSLNAMQITITPDGAVTDVLDGTLSGQLTSIVGEVTSLQLTTELGELVVLQFDPGIAHYFTMLNNDRFAVCQLGLESQGSQSVGLVGDGAWAGTNLTYGFDEQAARIDRGTQMVVQISTANLGDSGFVFALGDFNSPTTINSSVQNPPVAALPGAPFFYSGEWVQDSPSDGGSILLMVSPDGNYLGALFLGGTFDSPDLDNMGSSAIGSWLRTIDP